MGKVKLRRSKLWRQAKQAENESFSSFWARWQSLLLSFEAVARVEEEDINATLLSALLPSFQRWVTLKSCESIKEIVDCCRTLDATFEDHPNRGECDPLLFQRAQDLPKADNKAQTLLNKIRARTRDYSCWICNSKAHQIFKFPVLSIPEDDKQHISKICSECDGMSHTPAHHNTALHSAGMAE